MARRRRRGERDISTPIARFESDLLRPVRLVSPLRPEVLTRAVLPEVEDRRLFHPAPRALRPARELTRAKAQLVGKVKHSVKSAVATLLPGVAFERPSAVLVCVRRKDRREVLFALKRRGKGSRSRRRRRNQWSNVSC